MTMRVPPHGTQSGTQLIVAGSASSDRQQWFRSLRDCLMLCLLSESRLPEPDPSLYRLELRLLYLLLHQYLDLIPVSDTRQYQARMTFLRRVVGRAPSP